MSTRRMIPRPFLAVAALAASVPFDRSRITQPIDDPHQPTFPIPAFEPPVDSEVQVKTVHHQDDFVSSLLGTYSEAKHIAVNQKMLCDVLSSGKPTGMKRPVQVVEIKRDHKTQEPRSIRVKTLTGARRCIWVQPQYLSPLIEWEVDDRPHRTHFAAEAERNEPSVPDCWDNWHPE